MSEAPSLQEDTGKLPPEALEQDLPPIDADDTDADSEHDLSADDLLEGELEASDNDDSAEPAPATPSEDLTAKLAAALLKAEEYRDHVLRTQADMENLRRRTEKEIQDSRKFAVERFAKDLLVVLDSLELGIQAAVGDAPDIVKLREGNELTLKQFLAVLEKYQIKPIEALGQPFNPAFHQAMMMQPTDEAPPNTVVRVFQQGYTLNERLLRPAMVVVAQKP